MYKLSDKQKAELEQAVKTSCEGMTGSKVCYNVVDSDSAIESYNGLKEWQAIHSISGTLPVLANGATKSIYGSDLNELMRYWHDLTHMYNCFNFSLSGELSTALNHVSELSKLEVDQDIIKAVFFDIYGQAGYFDKHKKFIINGDAFVHDCFKNMQKTIECFDDNIGYTCYE